MALQKLVLKDIIARILKMKSKFERVSTMFLEDNDKQFI
jgi:hypothetical protein